MTDPIATLFIDGQWTASSSGATRTVFCPADQSEVGVVSEATAEDVERAILAARRAFDSRVWADTPAAERGDFLLRVADALQERKAQLLSSVTNGGQAFSSALSADDVRALLRQE